MALNLHLTEEVDAKLATLAESSGASKQQAIVSLIEDRYRRDQGRKFAEKELNEFFRSRQDLMDRLRDA